MRTSLYLITLLALAPVSPALSQELSDPFRFIIWPIEDARALGRGISPGRAVAVAGAGTGIWLLSRADRSLTERAARIESNAVLRFTQEFGHARVVRPALGVVLVGGLMAGNRRLQDASFTGLEAVLVANLVTNSMKSLFGRARPWQGEGPESFGPFSGNSSFPSGHATTAFAALTPFALYYGGVTGGGLFALATATAFSRMATNAHWLSDVIAGSLIGFGTGWVLTQRHRRPGLVTLTPGIAGASLEIRF